MASHEVALVKLAGLASSTSGGHVLIVSNVPDIVKKDGRPPEGGLPGPLIRHRFERNLTDLPYSGQGGLRRYFYTNKHNSIISPGLLTRLAVLILSARTPAEAGP
jgi:hypothetical protein